MYRGEACVFRDGQIVGHLTETGRELSFAYDPSWKGEAISPLFPLGVEARGEGVRAWFRNMLPEGRRRQTFEVLTRLSLDRITQFLAWFGEDLPGNISIIADKKSESRDITKIVKDIVASGGDLDYASFKLSLAGREPKTAVRIGENGNFLAPTADSPSTHIVKASRYLTFMEAFTLGLAQTAGVFPVVGFEVKSADGIPFLLIERYDRKIMADGKVLKLRQEDFCQALGRDRDDKYGIYGGVEHTDMARVMLERLPHEDIDRFLAMTFFSMPTGNADDHAKNFSMVMENGAWRLAPAYDLVSSAAVKRMALANDAEIPYMFSQMDERQARAFGKTYLPWKISGDDVKIMTDIFQTGPGEMQHIFETVRDGIANAVANTRAEDVFQDVEITDAKVEFGKRCLISLLETCTERLETVGKSLEKAFCEATHPEPSGPR